MEENAIHIHSCFRGSFAHLVSQPFPFAVPLVLAANSFPFSTTSMRCDATLSYCYIHIVQTYLYARTRKKRLAAGLAWLSRKRFARHGKEYLNVPRKQPIYTIRNSKCSNSFRITGFRSVAYHRRLRSKTVWIANRVILSAINFHLFRNFSYENSVPVSTVSSTAVCIERGPSG